MIRGNAGSSVAMVILRKVRSFVMLDAISNIGYEEVDIEAAAQCKPSGFKALSKPRSDLLHDRGVQKCLLGNSNPAVASSYDGSQPWVLAASMIRARLLTCRRIL